MQTYNLLLGEEASSLVLMMSQHLPTTS